jgi:hypothetical protein
MTAKSNESNSRAKEYEANNQGSGIIFILILFNFKETGYNAQHTKRQTCQFF